jgi:cysteine-rich repeat protein
MKTLPTRPTRASTPSGHPGRAFPELLMQLRPPTSLSFFIALALVQSGCFDPQVPGDGDGTGDGTTASDGSGSGSGSGTAESTGIEPDSGSGGPIPVCGDGVVEGSEVCDDGINDGSYGGCSAGCTAPGPFCGDGIVNGEEPCDDGDDEDGNGCNVDCVVSGSVLWTVTYDGPDHGVDAAGGVAVDPEDNIIVVGGVLSDVEEAWVRKYTPEGAAAWTQFFPSMVEDSSASNVVTLDDGDFVFGGGFDPASGANPDAWVRRVSAVGDPLWTETYANPYDGLDQVVDLERDDDGFLYALIKATGTPTPNGSRSFLRKYTQDGAELWTTSIDDGVTTQALATEQDGSCIIVGYEGQIPAYVPYLSRRTSDGTEEWSRTYPEYDEAYFTRVDVDASGRILAGLVSLASSNRILSVDAAGNVIDEFFPHAMENALALYAILSLNDGHYVAAGIKGADGHLWTSRYSADGSELWTHTYNGEEYGFGWDSVTDLAIDSLGNIIAVGNIQDAEATIQDIWVTKFAP